ncbi:hypothetical protein [Rivularia sp. UHCC 0363]|nr:hypothetical protein [Rivularia sp. UHCC 0363]MEA5595692.1 hypothetical protein [Rivularia sp. UHCC 0363]
MVKNRGDRSPAKKLRSPFNSSADYSSVGTMVQRGIPSVNMV